MGRHLTNSNDECWDSTEAAPEPAYVNVSSVEEMKPVDRMESESNDTTATANPVRMGESIGGRIERSGEVDYFRLQLRPEERGIVNLTVESRPYLRTDMELLDKRGRVLNRIGGGNVLGLKKTYSLDLKDDEYYLKLFQPNMSIVLLVDNSGSMEGRENDLKRAIEQFVSERNDQDRVAILNFAGGQDQTAANTILSKLPPALRARLPQGLLQVGDPCDKQSGCTPLGSGVGQLTDFTNDPKVLKAAAAQTGKAFGGTPLNVAMLKAIEKLEAETGNKAILLFSDGADTTSQKEYAGVWKKLAQSLGIRIYTVGLGQGLIARRTSGSQAAIFYGIGHRPPTAEAFLRPNPRS
jgi:hypothetical protein